MDLDDFRTWLESVYRDHPFLHDAKSESDIERLDAALKHIKGTSVLELGCQDGFFSLAFAANGYEAVGVDCVERWIHEANRIKAVYGLDNAIFICELIERIDLPPHSFDTVFMGEVLEHVLELEPVLYKARELTAQGGRWIVTVPNGVDNSPAHIRFLYEDTLRSFLEPYIEIKGTDVIMGSYIFCYGDVP